MENEFEMLCDLKKKIEKLTTRQQELLYKDCISKLDINATVNKQGVFFDLRKISNETIQIIIEFMKSNCL